MQQKNNNKKKHAMSILTIAPPVYGSKQTERKVLNEFLCQYQASRSNFVFVTEFSTIII